MTRPFNGKFLITGSLFWGFAALAFLRLGNTAGATTITFSPQNGNFNDPFTGNTESGYTVTPVTNNWFQGLTYGSPAPSIYLGPINSPTTGVLSVTQGGSPFNFQSLDYSSNNGSSSFTLSGISGGTTEFTESGLFTFPGTFVFSTYSSSPADAAIPIDTLIFSVTPLAGTSSFNLDTIVVSTPVITPEPSGLALLSGIAAAGLLRRVKRRGKGITP